MPHRWTIELYIYIYDRSFRDLYHTLEFKQLHYFTVFTYPNRSLPSLWFFFAHTFTRGQPRHNLYLKYLIKVIIFLLNVSLKCFFSWDICTYDGTNHQMESFGLFNNTYITMKLKGLKQCSSSFLFVDMSCSLCNALI